MFPLARYRFEFQVTQPIRLPDYAGSMLRGAFGHALRQLACMTRRKECAGCPLLASCPYPAIFAPLPPPSHALQKFSQIPVPYVIEPPAWGARQLGEGDSLIFHFVLIGRALKDLPLIILAWRRAFARGVGAGDGTAELVRVVHSSEAGDTEIHRPDTGALIQHAQEIRFHPDREADTTRISLEFTTPLRLQRNGHALPPEKLDARTLLMALARRANLLAEFHAHGPLVDDFPALTQACDGVHDTRQLVWRDWTRYSSRQHQAMTLGGVIGTWTLEGELAPFLPFLHLGKWLHVGKEAAFGLGRFTLDESLHGDISNNYDKNRERPFQLIERKETIA